MSAPRVGWFPGHAIDRECILVAMDGYGWAALFTMFGPLLVFFAWSHRQDRHKRREAREHPEAMRQRHRDQMRDRQEIWAAMRRAQPQVHTANGSTQKDAQVADGASDWRERYYGEYHRQKRAYFAAVIEREGGYLCTERRCLMPNQWIGRGERWHLAHDHEKGGPQDYLGPAHEKCNEHEARLRGVIFERDGDLQPPTQPPHPEHGSLSSTDDECPF